MTRVIYTAGRWRFHGKAPDGLATGSNGGADYLYAADFASGTIDVFDSSYAPHAFAGSFTDPSLPAVYAPFNVHVLGGHLYATSTSAVRGRGRSKIMVSLE